MSLKIGGSKSNSSQTTNATNHSTTTPIVPEWASSLTQNVAGRVGGLLNNDPQSLIAPANGLQNLAAANATNLSGTPWDYDAAEELTGAVANSETPNIAGNIGRFMNPYLSHVVDATSADLDANAGKVRAQQALNLAGSGAFGGSGAALTQSTTEGELARARATTLGNLRAQGYAQALGGATSQAQLQQQQQAQRLAAAGQLAGIAGEYGANQRANVATQAAIGGDLRGIAQQQAQAPVTSAQQIVAMLNGLPISLFAGQTTDGVAHTESKGTNSQVYAEASHDFAKPSGT
ncbi:hypothetical protein [Phenylobacterium sp.]|uniref:hypothetical protein n=1 Tax=Phenylobacterium sp. TaxID=1871053 RepID=UPI00374CA762